MTNNAGKKTAKRKVVHVNFPSELHDKLADRAVQERRDISELVRLVVEDWLDGKLLKG